MLTIRDEQLHTLGAERTAAFVERLIDHLRRYLPRCCSVLDARTLRAHVESIMSRARAYGITGERDVVKLASVALTLGIGFDRDPAFAWAQQILTAEGVGPTLRVNRLVIATSRRMFAAEIER